MNLTKIELNNIKQLIQSDDISNHKLVIMLTVGSDKMDVNELADMIYDYSIWEQNIHLDTSLTTCYIGDYYITYSYNTPLVNKVIKVYRIILNNVNGHEFISYSTFTLEDDLNSTIKYYIKQIIKLTIYET